MVGLSAIRDSRESVSLLGAVVSGKRITSNLPGYPGTGLDGFGKTVESRLNTRVCNGFMLLHQRGRANHIGMEDDREFSRELILFLG